MSPSLQHYKIHLINCSFEVPTASPSYTESQLHPKSCFHLELCEPRSYSQKPWALKPGSCTTETTRAEREVDPASCC